MNTAQDTRVSVDAIVTGKSSNTLSKGNGSSYVLIDCKINQPGHKAHNLVVTAQRTTINKEGKVKDLPEMGDNVVLYVSKVADKNDATKTVIFFELALKRESATQEQLAELF
jgi:hypothetical protein